MNIKNKILEIVKKIPEGKFLTYKEIAKKAGSPRAYRLVGNILAQNRDQEIPCHRVIRSDYLVGGYCGSEKNSYKKVGLLLKEGAIGVIPTDTIYGICTSAFKKDSVEKIYRLRKRNLKKPMIILISSFDDLKIFEVKLSKKQKEILKKLWPGKISVILPCPSKKFSYLHRGTFSLAFRLPKPKWLLDVLKISGPIVAPSANYEGEKPATNIKSAKRYFGNKVFYWDKGEQKELPSTLIKLENSKIEVLRKGADFRKIILLGFK